MRWWASVILVLGAPPVMSLAGVSAAEALQNPDAQSAATFVSGGVGAGERAHLNEISSGYNLRVVVARPDGAYLADVHLSIRDQGDREVLSTVTEGPLLLANLPPGKYSVTASTGQGVTRASVVVDRTHQRMLVIRMAEQ
jgi:hypothetical protein